MVSPRSSTVSPVVRVPAVRVPVTTVPAPLIVNARSTHSRTLPEAAGDLAVAVTSSRTLMSSGRPSPVVAETVTIGAASSVVPRSCALTWAFVVSTESGARSARVMTTRPWVMPRALIASRWSLDWACQPLSAAMTKQAMGAGPSPASMFERNFSCPGTSTKASSRPEGRVVQAKPRSMVSPRFFSSAHRSGSIPVRALTRVDFP